MARVFIAHADGEQSEAEKLARPLLDTGYEVIHHGTLLVGESLLHEAQKVLSAGGPVVICGTCKAAGSKWIRRISGAARKSGSGHLFVMQMEGDADVEDLALDGHVGPYWKDPAGAVDGLIQALQKYFPLGGRSSAVALQQRAEATYRRLVLDSCDIISLANLPEGDRHIATRRLEVRRLYVPLKVRIEESAHHRAGEQDLAAMLERFGAGEPEPPFSFEARTARFSVGTLLASVRRLVVLGDPGAGKSTLLRWIATAYLLRLKRDPDFGSVPAVTTLPDRDWLPILVRCRDLDPEAIGGPLDDVLRHTLRKSEMTEAEAEALRTVLRQKLGKDEAILLIDGLDEIATTAARIRFCEQLEKIQIAFPNAPIVVTSRLVGYREMGHRLGHGFEHVIVDDLAYAEKDDFVRRWCELTEPAERKATTAEELIRDIHSTDRIERLTGNPMLLTTMALVKRKVGRLPRRRADLYAEAVQVLLNWRQAESTDPLDAREARPQLQYLAYAMCERGVQRLREDEVLALLSQLRAEYPHLHTVSQHRPERFLELLERRTGILVRTGIVRHLGLPVPVYEFRHLTFQEYLAARALVEKCFPGARPCSLAEIIAPLAARPGSPPEGPLSEEGLRWHEVLRLFVACCPVSEVDSVLRAILQPCPGEEVTEIPLSRAASAALCLADEPDVSPALAQEILDRLGALIGSYSAGPAPGEAFRELMASRWRDEALAVLAREFLGRDSRSRWPVLLILLSCRELPLLSGSETINEQERQWLADLAPPFEDARAVLAASGLAQAAEHGGGLLDAVPHLLALLKYGGAVSHAAACALHSLHWGSHRVRLWMPTEEESHRLSEFVADPKSEPGAVCYAINLLGEVQATHAIAIIRQRLTDPDGEVRHAATQAAGQLGDRQAVELLLQRLEDPDQDVREAAARSLGNLRAWEALQPLRRSLGDASPVVRFAALVALWRLFSLRLPSWGSEEVAAFTQELLPFLNASEQSGSPTLVIRLLGALKSREAVPPLIELWRTKPLSSGLFVDGELLELAHALGQIGDPRAIVPLRQVFDRSPPTVQAAIVTAVCRLASPGETSWLVPLLRNHPAELSLAAAAGLKSVRDRRGARLVKQALRSEDEELRRQALGALAAFHGDREDVELVTCFVRDHGHPVDPQQPLELSSVEVLAQWCRLPFDEVRERFERLSRKIPLKLAWRKPRARRT